MAMIATLNGVGETVTVADYIYDDPHEPVFYYDNDTDNTGFDDYMQKLLISWDFPVPGFASSQKFDTAFWNAIKGTKQPDKWSTRSWLMSSPKYVPRQICLLMRVIDNAVVVHNLLGRTCKQRKRKSSTRKLASTTDRRYISANHYIQLDRALRSSVHGNYLRLARFCSCQNK